MGKMGNYRVGLQETGSYMFGWKSADRGEPRPIPTGEVGFDWLEHEGACLGWDDYHAKEVTPNAS